MGFHATEQEREDGADAIYWAGCLINMAELIGRVKAHWPLSRQEFFDRLFLPALDELGFNAPTRQSYVEKIMAGLEL